MQVLGKCGFGPPFSPDECRSCGVRVFSQVVTTAVGTCHPSPAAEPLTDVYPEIATTPLTVGIHIPFAVITICHHINTSEQRGDFKHL